MTSSNPTRSAGPASATGVGPREITRIVGIAKAYVTRVGSGPFSSRCSTASLPELLVEREDMSTWHEHRSCKRRPGWLDAVMLRQAARLNSLSEIALTKLDVLSELETVKVCVAYEADGERLARVPLPSVGAAQGGPGLRRTLVGRRIFRERPPSVTPPCATARDYVACIEAHAGVPVSFVGVGPGREQYVSFAK